MLYFVLNVILGAFSLRFYITFPNKIPISCVEAEFKRKFPWFTDCILEVTVEGHVVEEAGSGTSRRSDPTQIFVSFWVEVPLWPP